MSTITQKNNTEPATPPSGSTTIYPDATTKKLTTKNDAGAVTSYASEQEAEQAKVSANDTTKAYLESKIVAGANVTVTTLNDGANETLQISATGGGGGDLHPMDKVEWLDHFLSRGVASAFNWSSLVAGTSQVFANVNKSSFPFLSATEHFGTINLNLNGTSGRCIFYQTLSAEPSLQLGYSRKWIQEWRVYIDTLATGAADYVLNVGWHGATAADDSTNGIYIQYKQADSLNWQLVSKVGASEARTVSAIPVTTGWHVIRIEIAADLSKVDMIIDGVTTEQSSPVLATGGIVNDYGVMFAIRQGADTNQKLFALDYFYMKAEVIS